MLLSLSVCLFVYWMLCDAKCSPFFWQGSLYEQDKVSFSGSLKTFRECFPVFNNVVFPTAQQVKAIERFMRRLEFHLSKVCACVCVRQMIIDGTNVTDQS